MRLPLILGGLRKATLQVVPPQPWPRSQASAGWHAT